MLDAALEARVAIEQITEEKRNDLRQYEVTEEEWKIVQQLRDVLKVSHTCQFVGPPPQFGTHVVRQSSGILRCNPVLLALRRRGTGHHQCYSGDGQD